METTPEAALTTEEIKKRLKKDPTYGRPGNPIIARFSDHQDLGYGLTFCPPLVDGMKRFDLYFGFWEAREQIIDPFSKQILILLWEFVPSAKGPCRTGIPMSVDRAEQFNKANQSKLANMHTQQLMPAGEVIQILDIIPNPYQAVATNTTKLAKKTW